MRDIQSIQAAAFVAALSVLANFDVLADDPTPEQILASRGLKRSGMAYVVTAESEFVPKVAKLQPSYAQLKGLYDKLATAMQIQAEYDVLNDQWTLVNERLRNVQAEIDAHPPLSNNELRQNWQNLLDTEKQLRFQYNELNREVNLRYRRLVPDSEKEELRGEFVKKREEFLESSRDLRALADKIKDEYSALAKDNSVKNAVASLKLSTKTSITVVASNDFKKASTWLTNAVRSTSPESLAPKTTKKGAKNTSKGKSTIKAKAAGAGNQKG